MSKEILEEALKDAKLLKEAAIETARNSLIEAISPQIEQKVSESLGEDLSEMGMYEGEDEGEDKEMDFSELEDDEGEKDEGFAFEAKDDDKEDDKEDLDEAKGDDEDEDDLDEIVNITSEDLKAALAEVMDSELSEASVTSGFGDVEDATILASGGPGAKGIADEKSGEHQWKDEAPPAKEDWTVAESKYRKMIKQLRNENAQYKKAYGVMRNKIQEVNLFNSKLLHTNKLLQMAELNNKQRLTVIESVDRASNLREVELVYKSLSESFKIAGVLKESRRPLPKTAKGSRYTPASSTVLKEGVEHEDSSEMARWKELSGLVK